MVFWKDKKDEKSEKIDSESPKNFYDQDFDDDLPIDDSTTTATLVDYVLLNRPLKAVLAILLIAVVMPTLLYAFMYGVEPPPAPFGSCVVLPEFWSECSPGRTPDEKSCINIGCCWNSTYSYCFHSIPSRQTYKLKDVNSNPEKEAAEMVPRFELTPFLLPSLPVYLSVVARNVFQATIQLTSSKHTPPTSSIPLEDSKIKIDMKNLTEGFWLTLWRRDSGEALFSTENGPLIASDGFWETSFQFSEHGVVIGAGSAARGTLRLNSGNVTLYASSRSSNNGRPFILSVHKNGTAHGVLFESPGAIEVVGRKSNLVTIRSTAKDKLTLQVFVGDSPAEVIKHLTEFIKSATMPPSWSLGLHVCRDDARNDTNNAVEIFYTKANEQSLPYDSDCIDESSFGNTSFTQERLNQMNKDLIFMRQVGIKYVMNLFPQISNDSNAFFDAKDRNLLLRCNDSELFLGIHREKGVGYPDYTSENVVPWLEINLLEMLNGLIVSPDGLVLPENWPQNEDDAMDDDSDMLPYIPMGLEGSLSNGTVWWQALHMDDSIHLTKHAHYGSSHALSATKALRTVLNIGEETRMPVFTGSKWDGVSTWLGEEQPATWDGLKSALLSVMEAGISGEPFSGGGAICGSHGDWNEALCTRWSLLALSVFPTVRYHHAWGEPSRDPSSMTNNMAKVVARAARLRYQLLPYLYTLAYEAVTTGFPLVRPMVLEFPKDNGTWSLDEQLMLGPALLVAPVLRPADVAVNIYLPKPGWPWFYFQGGEQVNQYFNASGNVTILVGETELVMLMRGGYIIVMQEEREIGSTYTTSEALSMSRLLLVALNCIENTTECTASGSIYLEDEVGQNGLLLDLNATQLSVSVPGLQNTPLCPTASNNSHIIEVTIYGMPGMVTGPVEVNGILESGAQLMFNEKRRRLVITNIDVDWCKYTDDIVISWTWSSGSSTTLAD